MNNGFQLICLTLALRILAPLHNLTPFTFSGDIVVMRHHLQSLVTFWCYAHMNTSLLPPSRDAQHCSHSPPRCRSTTTDPTLHLIISSLQVRSISLSHLGAHPIICLDSLLADGAVDHCNCAVAV